MLNALTITSMGTMLKIIQEGDPLIIKGLETTTIINLLIKKGGIVEEEDMKEEAMLAVIVIKSLVLKRDTKIKV